MWEPVEVTPVSVLIGVGWLAAPSAIVASWLLDIEPLGDIGIFLACGVATLTVIRDNQRTRRMLKRPGERLASVARSQQQ